MLAYTSAGYDIVGILGVNGSPSCGTDTTCVGYTGGEIDSCNLALQKKQLAMVSGAGVFIEVLQQMLVEHQLKIPFLASSIVAD